MKLSRLKRTGDGPPGQDARIFIHPPEMVMGDGRHLDPDVNPLGP